MRELVTLASELLDSTFTRALTRAAGATQRDLVRA